MISFNKVDIEYIKDEPTIKNLSLEIDYGEFVYITGVSGSGKSTLLKAIYAEIRPARGIMQIAGFDITDIQGNMIPYLRRNIGVVFQDFRLLEEKTVFDNVRIALDIFDIDENRVRNMTHAILHDLELFEQREQKVCKLSGGEKQRVAVARAIVNEPRIIIADEPTGNLDKDNSINIINILQNSNRKGSTVIVATHDMELKNYFPMREIKLDKGHLVDDTRHTSRVE